MKNLQNKNILLFLPRGKGIYGSGITRELENRGAYVAVYDERPSTAPAVKILLRLTKRLIEPYLLHYFNKIIQQNKDVRFNFVLIIRGEGFTRKVLKKFKDVYPEAFYILYLWDSIKYNNTTSLFPYFNRVLSFDVNDVKKYPGLILRPLFFLPQYRAAAKKRPGLIDILFIGTVHSDRYRFILSLESLFRSQGLSTFFYFYFPGKLMFWLKKLTDPAFRRCRMSDFQFDMISADEASAYLEKAKASLDVEGPGQTGLTMRTIEVLGAKRKLITTNKTIRHYDFFNENNVLIVDRNNPKIDLKFINEPFIEIDPAIYEHYSIEAWIDDLFFGSNMSYIKETSDPI